MSAPASALGRAWALITGFYGATLLLCVVLVLPRVQHFVADDLGQASAAAAQAAAQLIDQVPADHPSPLPPYLALLKAQAERAGWARYELRDAVSGNVLMPAVPPPLGWLERRVAEGPGASQVRPVVRQGERLWLVQVWVPTDAAYALLRDCALAVLGSFALLGALMLASLFGLLRWAMAPMQQFQAQIQGLSERRFVALQEPRVAEWGALSRLLNVMVARVQHMLDERDQSVEALEGRLARDELTHTASRPVFMKRLVAALKEADGRGCMAVVHVHDLEGMNRRLGRARANEVLVSAATVVRARLLAAGLADSVLLARLNGADFGLVQRGAALPAWQALLEDIAGSLQKLAQDGLCDSDHVAWIGGTGFRSGEGVADVMLRIDAMVAAAEVHRQPVSVCDASQSHHGRDLNAWRVLLETALDTGRVALRCEAVRDTAGRTLHLRARLRAQLPDGAWLEFEDLAPPATRNGRIVNLDLRAVQLALAEAARAEVPMAVPVAWQSLQRPIFLRQLKELLGQQPDAARLLVLELAEPGFDAGVVASAQAVAAAVAPWGTGLALVDFGVSLSTLPLLEAGRLRYVLLSPRLLAGVPGNAVAQGFVGQLAQLGARVQIPMLARPEPGGPTAEQLQALGLWVVAFEAVAPLAAAQA